MITIIIDKQEKLPYSFSSNFNTRIETLDTGDYTIDGHKEKFCIERKSLSDFITSVTEDSTRFFKEIERMKSFEFSCIIVEGLIRDIIAHNYSNNYTPESILLTTANILVKHRIPIIFCETRQHAIHFLEKMITVYLEPEKKKTKEKKSGKPKGYDKKKLL